MRIVFVSNYFNHHQRPLSEAFDRLTEGSYYFIETGKMREDRRKLGYGMDDIPAYVLQSFAGEEALEKCRQLILDADVVITGSAPQSLLKPRIKAGKLLFHYSERLFKQGIEPRKYLPRLLRYHVWNPPGKPIYLLCAGGYTAADYRKLGLFRNRCFRWGYFPEEKQYDEQPRKDANRILWAGRFLDWKHPEDALAVAKRLREEGYSFQMELIGTGELEQALKDQVTRWGLSDCVCLPGSMKPEQVRAHMERSGIFLFTSDRQEGWGAVLNEAMNSGCAVVASDAIGAVPYLVKDGENGLVYHYGDGNGLYEKVKHLLTHPDEQLRLGLSAYETITQHWNAETAARRLIALAGAIASGENAAQLFDSDVCSSAPCIDDKWS